MRQVALINACKVGDLAAARSLLKRGADPAWVVPDGDWYAKLSGPAVLTAITYGRIQIVRLLLEQRPDLMMTHGCTMLDYAIAGLGDRSDRAERDRYIQIIQLLIEHKVDINRPDLGGYTPLMVAARGGQLDVVRVLISAGAVIRDTSSQGETALSLAKSPVHPKPDHGAIAQLLEQALRRP